MALQFERLVPLSPVREWSMELPAAARRVLPGAHTGVFWRDRHLGALAAATAFALAWYGANTAGRASQVAVCWLLLTGMHAALVVYSRRVAGLPDVPKPARRFWRALAITGAAYFVGDVVQLVAIVRDPLTLASATGVPFQSAAVDLGTLFLVIVLLTSPLGFSSARQRTRFWLDTATVMVAAGAFSWYFSVGHDASVASDQRARALNDLLLGVVILVGMFAVVKLLLSGSRPFTGAAGWLIVAAAGIEGVAQAVTGMLVLADGLNLVFAVTLLANALLTASARVQLRQVAADPAVLRGSPARPYSLLPYGALAATYGLLVMILSRSGLDSRAWMVLGTAIASTGLVVVRQVAAFAENAHLLVELDAKVRERDELAAALHHQAFHDSLTGLANRALFTDRLEAALARGRRASTATAVMIIDLDDFKPVNDRLGHRAGDDLLKEVATRLAACVRETDTMARLGGDEFAALLEHPVKEGIATVAERIKRTIADPITVADEVVHVGASIGVAVGRGGEGTADALLNDADVAMYVAKNRGKGGYEISPNSKFERRGHALPQLPAAASTANQWSGADAPPGRRRTDRWLPDTLLEDAPRSETR